MVDSVGSTVLALGKLMSTVRPCALKGLAKLPKGEKKNVIRGLSAYKH